MTKVKVIKDFFDIKEQVARKEGEVFECDGKRKTQLENAGRIKKETKAPAKKKELKSPKETKEQKGTIENK